MGFRGGGGDRVLRGFAAASRRGFAARGKGVGCRVSRGFAARGKSVGCRVSGGGDAASPRGARFARGFAARLRREGKECRVSGCRGGGRGFAASVGCRAASPRGERVSGVGCRVSRGPLRGSVECRGGAARLRVFGFGSSLLEG